MFYNRCGGFEVIMIYIIIYTKLKLKDTLDLHLPPEKYIFYYYIEWRFDK